jgi:peptidoglycan glycosyltransferase
LWFTGFAPANDPQIAIAVVVENEEGFGDSVASPIARKVIEAVLSK